MGERIRDVLDRSKFLIVVCSPAAARSGWVNEEIAYFEAVHGREQILCVIVEGEPFLPEGDAEPWRECFPHALLTRPNGERVAIEEQPVAADLRPSGDGRRLAILKLVAGMLGVELDALIHRDARRRQEQLTAITALSVVGMAVMGGLTAAALSARNDARERKAQAEGLIEFMLVDLRKTLEPAGRLDALDVVGQRALAYYTAQPTGRLDADSLGRRARVLHLLGDVEDQRGDLGDALRIFRQAAVSTEELLAREPENPQRIYDHAQSAYWVGYIAWRRGDSREATSRFQEYQKLADRLVALDPDNDVWRAEVGYANSNLGTVLLEAGKTDDAAAAFQRSLATNLALVQRSPGDQARLADLGQSYAWNADAQLMRGEFIPAMTYRLAERKIYADMLALSPTDATARQSLIVNRQGVANILIQQRKLASAIAELQLADLDANALLQSDRDNTRYQERAVSIYITMGQVEMARGDYAAAGRHADTGLEMAKALIATDPTVLDWSGRLLSGARLLQIRVAAQTAPTEAAEVAALAPAAAEFARLSRLQKDNPHDIPLAYAVAEAAILAGDYASKMRDPASAHRIWSQVLAMIKSVTPEKPDHKYGRSGLIYSLLQDRQTPVRSDTARQREHSSARYNW